MTVQTQHHHRSRWAVCTAHWLENSLVPLALEIRLLALAAAAVAVPSRGALPLALEEEAELSGAHAVDSSASRPRQALRVPEEN